MIVSVKENLKLSGIAIMTFCAVFVCNLFMNYNIDIQQIEDQITDPMGKGLYDAQCIMSRVTCVISGGCLMATTAVLLFFYIRQYINSHNKELGILKALGYSRIKIASNFFVFGVSVLIGTTLGYAGSFLLMPEFYKTMNQDGYLPNPDVTVNWYLAILFVLVPTIASGLLAVVYSYIKLKLPALDLLREQQKLKEKKLKKETKTIEISFLENMKRNNVRSHPALIFFIAFGAFCYSSMMQMSASMKELSSAMTGVMIFCIGIALAVTSMIIATTTVVNANAKSISIMKVYGYSFKECTGAVLSGYRNISYIGFAIGTIYQYALMKGMVTLFSANSDIDVPEVVFKWNAFWVTLISFIIAYELMMYYFARHIRNMSLKQIMQD